MTRLNLILIVLVAVFATAFGASLLFGPMRGLTEDEVRSILSAELAAANTAEQKKETPVLDAATIEPMIETYLLANPSLLEKMSIALSIQREAEQAERNRLAIASIHDEIFNDPDHAIVGSPDGDVTLVEMYDYNCSYCRTAVADMTELLADDPNLRVVLQELPILSQGSVDAARIAVAATRAGIDYWAFHSTLFSSRGQVTGEMALDTAESLGLDREALAADAETDAVSKIIQKNYSIAQTLSISGTPAYIIGDEVISGAIGADALKQLIGNMRACGKTSCD